jgi:putative protein kinase ArgK-like GTPase of G3E family
MDNMLESDFLEIINDMLEVANVFVLCKSDAESESKAIVNLSRVKEFPIHVCIYIVAVA